MAYLVSSWFVDQCSNHFTEPKRVFTIGSSDYSSRVIKWPKIKPISGEIKSTQINIPLENTSGDLNTFHENVYTMPQCCNLKIGFTHPDSGDELITLYTGKIKNVQYDNRECVITLRDKLWNFTQQKIGSTASGYTVTLSDQIPSDIFWTLCTCYGGLDTTADSSNPDIYYPDFLVWAGQFSADNITNEAFYDGQKVTEALQGLIEMNDSAIWVTGDGKIHVSKFSDPDSNSIILTNDELTSPLKIDLQGLKLINKQTINFNYSNTSDYWQDTLSFVNTASVNSYGIHEEIMENEHIWFTSSADANNLADRLVTKFKNPPKKYELNTTLYALYRQIGETVKIIDGFWGITSETGWRITETEVDMNGAIKLVVDESATSAAGFYLDVSRFDSDDRLL